MGTTASQLGKDMLSEYQVSPQSKVKVKKSSCYIDYRVAKVGSGCC